MLEETKEAKSKRLKAERDARYKAKKKESSQTSIGEALVAQREVKEAHDKFKDAHPKVAKAWDDIGYARVARDLGPHEPGKIELHTGERKDLHDYVREKAALLPPIHMPPTIPGFGNITKGLPPRTPEDDEDEPILQRQPKAPVLKAPKAPPKPKAEKRPRVEGMTMVMSRTYQRDGKVAGGTAVRGNAKQLSIMFPNKLFDKLAALAQKNGVSCSEQVRQFVAKLLEDA